MLTQERLKALISYNKKTGVITRTLKVNHLTKTGIPCGTVMRTGYKMMHLDGGVYYNHRIIWLYVYGYFPENHIDHINRDKLDNRFINLREVSVQCNSRNQGLRRTNTSGIKGVSWSNQKNKWNAYIKVEGKRKHLGNFSEIIDAAKARYEAEKNYKFPDCDVRSTALKYINEHPK